jgi:dihydroorotate dehydrogenase electron transfer subunit
MPEDRALRIQSNQRVGDSYYLLSLELDTEPPAWEPGQFAMLSLRDRIEPLLRRPFSIYSLYDAAAAPAALQFLYKICGRGTALMAAARPGDLLSCLFPLGRGFRPEQAGGKLILVAGGAGIASLHPLAAAEVREGRTPLVLFGERHKTEIAAAEPTRALGIETLVATDDGSVGFHGYVSDLLEMTLRERGTQGKVICACGPTPMMKATAAVAASRDIRCYLALESTMACGFGVCVGCVVGVRGDGTGEIQYSRTCIDGPVMNAREVIW